MRQKTLYCLLIAAALAPPQARAGWLLWESPEEVPAPAGEKVISSAKEPADLVPEFAFSRSGKEKIPANLFFSANLSTLRFFAAGIGCAECETRLIKSAGEALKKIYSGQKPTSFLPAKNWLLGKRPQDISFCAARRRRFEIYFWRLPLREPGGAPFWAAAVYGPAAQSVFDAALKTSKAKKTKIKNTRSKTGSFLISIRE